MILQDIFLEETEDDDDALEGEPQETEDDDGDLESEPWVSLSSASLNDDQASEAIEKDLMMVTFSYFLNFSQFSTR